MPGQRKIHLDPEPVLRLVASLKIARIGVIGDSLVDEKELKDLEEVRAERRQSEYC